jgi:hypothetical protein
MGFFGDEQVTVRAGALIDSYDSRVGPYVPPAERGGPPTGSARVGCNGSVSVGGLLGTTLSTVTRVPVPTACWCAAATRRSAARPRPT